MQQERRNAHRAHIPGVKLTFESATDEPEEATALDISPDGIFIRTARPAAVGKRLAIELRLPADERSWSALGRVRWSRAGGDATRPSGMGVQLIDIDEAAFDAIRRALESLPPSRERTVRGIGVAAPPVVSAVEPRPRRRRVEPAALLVAAAVALVLSLTHDRIPWARIRTFAATPAMSTTAAPASLPNVAPPPAASTSAAIVSTTAAVEPSTAAIRASPAPSAAPPTSKPSRASPARSWATPRRRPTSSPNDNPY
jgi:uncharacterized protein (TIGR02266 family)